MTTGAEVKAARGVRNIWTRVREALKQVHKIEDALLHIDDLQKRITDLEARLQRCPGEGCPHCGALAYRVDYVDENVGFGARKHHRKCEACGFRDSQVIERTTRR
jgi:hypothetical protein